MRVIHRLKRKRKAQGYFPLFSCSLNSLSDRWPKRTVPSRHASSDNIKSIAKTWKPVTNISTIEMIHKTKGMTIRYSFFMPWNLIIPTLNRGGVALSLNLVGVIPRVAHILIISQKNSTPKKFWKKISVNTIC